MYKEVTHCPIQNMPRASNRQNREIHLTINEGFRFILTNLILLKWVNQAVTFASIWPICPI